MIHLLLFLGFFALCVTAYILVLLRQEETLQQLIIRKRMERALKELPKKPPSMKTLPKLVRYFIEHPVEVDLSRYLPGRPILCGDCGLVSELVGNLGCTCGGTSWVPAGRGRLIVYTYTPGFYNLPAPRYC